MSSEDPHWVNGYVQIVVPLDDVTWGSTTEAKSEALTSLIETVSDLVNKVFPEAVVAGKWHNVYDGEPADNHHHMFVKARCIHCGVRATAPEVYRGPTSR